jgi:5'(3')-deoxyribonucleotidase
MDGVLANFDSAISRQRGEPYVKVDDPPEMFVKGFFRNLPVMPGAAEGIHALLQMPKLALYIGFKFSNKNVNSATEKLEWLYEHFPKLARHCMLSCDKGLLRGDYLIDDDRKWEHQFQGKFLHFDPQSPSEQNWQKIVEYFKKKYDSDHHSPST